VKDSRPQQGKARTTAISFLKRDGIRFSEDVE